MFDNISFTIDNFEKEDFDNLIENYIQKQPNKRGEEWFQCNWANLRINYFPNQRKIKITNSLHKWYNSEILGIGLINHNDFKKSQVIESVNFLENAFNRPASEMRFLGRFEYGININTHSINPYDIIDRYISSITTSVNPFYAFYNKYGKPYSKFCSFTNYNIKAYDKSKEAGITNSNIFRFEIVHHNSIRTRKVFEKSNISMEDLTDDDIWEKCFSSILNCYNSIRVLGFPDCGTENYAKTLCYSYPTVRKDYKNYLKKHKNELKEAHDFVKNSENNPHFLIRDGLLNNFQKLILN